MKEGESIIKLDYSLENPEDRKKLVEQIITENPNLSNSYLEILANYLILCMEKQEKKNKKILTDNRLATITKRETSFEGITSQLENGEDGIYNLITENKHIIYQPKISITKKDLTEIPYLPQLREAITSLESIQRAAYGKEAYIIKKALIEMRKDQYVIKQAYKKPIALRKITRSLNKAVVFDDNSFLALDGSITLDGISLMDKNCVSIILQNYSRLKEESFDNFRNDTWYLIQDFEKVCDKALEKYPVYMRILECKIDGLQNIEIQEKLQLEFGIKHSLEYISSLWRNKIPKLIAAQAQRDFIEFNYRKYNKKFKKCSQCGQKKPAHNAFFSKNNTSNDGYYSMCKECRNRRYSERKKA